MAGETGTGGTGGTQGTQGTQGAPGGGTGTAPWHQGIAPEITGLWQNKGYDINDPVKVATELTKAYTEAEKFIGAPAAKVLRIADPTDEAGFRAMWQRLGAPSDAKEYDLGAAFAPDKDGKPVNEALGNTLRAAFAQVNVPKHMAAAIAGAIAKYNSDQTQESMAAQTAAIETERAELRKNWGQNFDANMLVAKNAAQRLGIKPEVAAALEKLDGVGYGAVMEMFRDLGSRLQEDKFITAPNAGGGSGGIMSKDQATARKQELMRDDAWRDRYLNGGAAEIREMTSLNTILSA